MLRVGVLRVGSPWVWDCRRGLVGRKPRIGRVFAPSGLPIAPVSWRTMKCLVRTVVVVVLVLGSCSKHPLAGGWREHVQGGGEGLGFEFDPGSDRLQVHGRPRPDGGHEHLSGTYSLDGQRLRIEWTEAGKKIEMQGTMVGDSITLSGPGSEKLEFHRGAAGQHH